MLGTLAAVATLTIVSEIVWGTAPRKESMLAMPSVLELLFVLAFTIVAIWVIRPAVDHEGAETNFWASTGGKIRFAFVIIASQVSGNVGRGVPGSVNESCAALSTQVRACLDCIVVGRFAGKRVETKRKKRKQVSTEISFFPTKL